MKRGIGCGGPKMEEGRKNERGKVFRQTYFMMNRKKGDTFIES